MITEIYDFLLSTGILELEIKTPIMILLVFELFIYVSVLVTRVASTDSQTTLDVVMPNITTEFEDTSICTAVKIPHDRAYITKFTPFATMDRAHHIQVFACEEPGLYQVIQ